MVRYLGTADGPVQLGWWNIERKRYQHIPIIPTNLGVLKIERRAQA